MKFEFNNEEESDEIMARMFNPEIGLNVTILTAPEDTLQEDGPVVTQITDSDVYVIYSDEYVERKLAAAFDKNREEFGEAMAFTIGLSFLISTAINAATEKFNENCK